MSTRRNAGTHPHYSHSRDPNPVKGAWQPDEDARVIAVSYTHLTLPTICSV